MRKLPPLNALKTFECAARHLHYSRAADELHVTPGAVSRAIANLESYLSVQLFDRSASNRLSLTDAGEAYLPYVVKALDSLVCGTNEIQLYRGQGGILRVGVLPTFSIRWLIPKLHHFQNQHPYIVLDVKSVPSDFSLGLKNINLDDLDLDVAIYFGDINWHGFDQIPFCQEKLIPVASPNLADSLIQLKTNTQNFSELPFLQHSTRPYAWQLWFEQYYGTYVEPRWRARFEHYFMLIEAAITGLGIALVPSIFVEKELQSGELTSLTSHVLQMKEYYFLSHRKIRADELKIRTFREWMMSDAVLQK